MDGPDNMALDEALLLRARATGETVLRTYTWAVPTLSLGRNQRAAGEYDTAMLARAGLAVVRRPTGGRALVHHREITYSVTAPVAGPLGHTYARINALLINALGALGVPTGIAERRARAPVPSGLPCFAEPGAGELVAEGRKLVGSAQWRDDGALLQHGSILVDDDQGLLAGLRSTSPDAVPPPATLRALLGRAPSVAEFSGHLLDAVRALEDPACQWWNPEPAVLCDAARLALRYRDPAWTWRR